MGQDGELRSSRVTEVLQAVGDLAIALSRSAVIEKVGRTVAQSIGADMGFVGLANEDDQLRLGGFHGTKTHSLGRIRLAAKGLSNPEIAAELFLARGTVKAYMETAFRKLAARNRVEAVMIAARSGLLDDVKADADAGVEADE